jgi:hypothetical protein
MMNGTATAGSNTRSTRSSMQHSVIPALFVATGLALAYAGALAALLLGSR